MGFLCWPSGLGAGGSGGIKRGISRGSCLGATCTPPKIQVLTDWNYSRLTLVSLSQQGTQNLMCVLGMAGQCKVGWRGCCRAGRCRAVHALSVRRNDVQPGALQEKLLFTHDGRRWVHTTLVHFTTECMHMIATCHVYTITA